jgi:hypothetical protein
MDAGMDLTATTAQASNIRRQEIFLMAMSLRVLYDSRFLAAAHLF